MTHGEMLPECIEREARAEEQEIQTTEQFRVVNKKLDRIEVHLIGDGNPDQSIMGRLSKHAAYWKIFAIVGSIIAGGGVIAGVVGTIYAMTR